MLLTVAGVVLLCASSAAAQELRPTLTLAELFTSHSSLGQSTDQQSTPQPAQPSTPAGTDQKPKAPTAKAQPNPEPPRILGIMPNFRAVSAGVRPPPPTPRQAFKIATLNSFDYSSFIFVGVTSLLSEGFNDHPPLGKGVPGFGRYYWRGFVDKTDGNYLVIFLMPTIFHQDERYFALGSGSFMKRLTYSLSRIIITPSYQGHDSFNASELLGRGLAQAISVSYYPNQTRTFGGIASKFGYAIGRDALTNAFREFWPDIAVHVLHRHP